MTFQRPQVLGSYCFVLTSRPLTNTEVFEIEILAMPWKILPAGLAFGVTTHSPKEMMDLPASMCELTTGTWMLDWHSYVYREHIVMVNGEAVNQNFVSGDDLRSLETAKYELKPEKGSSMRALLSAIVPQKTAPGDRVALYV